MVTIKITQKEYEQIRKNHPFVSAHGKTYADHKNTCYWGYNVKFEDEDRFNSITARIRIIKELDGSLTKRVSLCVGASTYLLVIFNNYKF